MKQIDKHTHRADFDIYTVKYLQDAQTDEGDFYPQLSSKASYEDGFSEGKYKSRTVAPSQFKGWLEVLKREQEQDDRCRCCYCMRELHGNDISVEHLIPESFEGLDIAAEYEHYCAKAPELKRHVVLGSTFDKISQRIRIDVTQLKRKPHLIAHSNLFPACKAEIGCSCNNSRGNKRILPLMLMDGVENWVIYKPNGKVQIKYTEDIQAVIDTFKHLQINDDTLIQIRHLWYLFSRKQLVPTSDDASTEAGMQALMEQAFDGNVDKDYQHYYTNDYYRTLVPQYNWFYNYYLNKYPIQQA